MWKSLHKVAKELRDCCKSTWSWRDCSKSGRRQSCLDDWLCLVDVVTCGEVDRRCQAVWFRLLGIIDVVVWLCRRSVWCEGCTKRWVHVSVLLQMLLIVVFCYHARVCGHLLGRRLIIGRRGGSGARCVRVVADRGT